MSSTKKLILVIGATGAQGIAVIDKLLEPAADGSPSPYAVRALTRDPSSRRAKQLAEKGVELVKGAFDDLPSVLAALQGVWGVWNNTDGFTVGEVKEIFSGIRIFELAKQVKTVRHYVWSNLDYSFKKGGYNPAYRVEHYDGKGRVAEWMQAQPSIVSDDGMSWSVVTSGPYMEMLEFPMFGPIGKRPDGTYVFASPVQDGHVPMVTGEKAEFLRQALDEWFDNWLRADYPAANERAFGDGSTTWRQNFTGFWAQFRDDVITRDFEWLRKVNPDGYTLESWMRAKDYRGSKPEPVLKNVEDDKGVRLNRERVSQLLGVAEKKDGGAHRL
ncbi:NAD-P-binding protein [Lentinus tigrinus ALCF2SS1-7]|uniref:NAD-P-binding protein n=1 Tax=Lentinus tigrinus ALCF2SS1-6 TaxID=1328759 RepID=A0A5C2S4S1_9APHY|nr:NAD-P-binding protein [Lentinus tigrinus ALCF2SS1-6]RPD72785.1 NAD-P-binding protein [Lentinus tigrinus ALCF2SS1-7]